MPDTPQPLAIYEPADGYLFSPAPSGALYGKPYEIGTHGYWPGRPGPRATFILNGPSIRAAKLGELSMLEIAPQLARALGIEFHPGPR